MKIKRTVEVIEIAFSEDGMLLVASSGSLSPKRSRLHGSDHVVKKLVQEKHLNVGIYEGNDGLNGKQSADIYLNKSKKRDKTDPDETLDEFDVEGEGESDVSAREAIEAKWFLPENKTDRKIIRKLITQVQQSQKEEVKALDKDQVTLDELIDQLKKNLSDLYPAINGIKALTFPKLYEANCKAQLAVLEKQAKLIEGVVQKLLFHMAADEEIRSIVEVRQQRIEKGVFPKEGMAVSIARLDQKLLELYKQKKEKSIKSIQAELNAIDPHYQQACSALTKISGSPWNARFTNIRAIIATILFIFCMITLICGVLSLCSIFGSPGAVPLFAIGIVLLVLSFVIGGCSFTGTMTILRGEIVVSHKNKQWESFQKSLSKDKDPKKIHSNLKKLKGSIGEMLATRAKIVKFGEQVNTIQTTLEARDERVLGADRKADEAQATASSAKEEATSASEKVNIVDTKVIRLESELEIQKAKAAAAEEKAEAAKAESQELKRKLEQHAEVSQKTEERLARTEEILAKLMSGSFPLSKPPSEYEDISKNTHLAPSNRGSTKLASTCIPSSSHSSQ